MLINDHDVGYVKSKCECTKEQYVVTTYACYTQDTWLMSGVRDYKITLLYTTINKIFNGKTPIKTSVEQFVPCFMHHVSYGIISHKLDQF